MPSKYDPQKHHRRSIRLPDYDYSQPGAYYVTIVAWHRECLFGEVVNGEMRLNKFGLVAKQQWEKLPDRFPNIGLGAYVVMPNHTHGIIVIKIGRGTAGNLDSCMSHAGKNLSVIRFYITDKFYCM